MQTLFVFLNDFTVDIPQQDFEQELTCDWLPYLPNKQKWAEPVQSLGSERIGAVKRQQSSEILSGRYKKAHRLLPRTSGTIGYSQWIFRTGIFSSTKKKNPTSFFVGVCWSVGLRGGQQEFCWQTSQLAVLLLRLRLARSCASCAANFSLCWFRVYCLSTLGSNFT